LCDNCSNSITTHLEKAHGITQAKRRFNDIDALGLDASQPRDQAILNSLADSYDAEHFKQLLIQWVVYDNIAFRKVESERFYKLLTYLNSRVQLPSANQLRQWIVLEYQAMKHIILEQLHQSQGQIHLSFDLWTSRNLMALNGVVAHFVTCEGASKTLLLALPEQDDDHIGINIADTVAEVIEEFRISSRLGYFVLDNAGNNDTCIRQLATRYSFNAEQRRLRCMGHVINLIARSLLFGKNPDVVEDEVNRAS